LPTYPLHYYLSDDDSESSEYDYYVPPTKPTPSEFRTRLNNLVDEIVGTEPARLSAFDDQNWDPEALEIADFPNPFGITDQFLNAAATHSYMELILQRSTRPVAFELADVGLDAMGYLVLACRRLLHLKSSIRDETTVYPEENFISELSLLGDEITVAMFKTDLF
jgi:hypothetical protein